MPPIGPPGAWKELGESGKISGTCGAPVIASDETGSFAWSVLAERHPGLIRQVREALPYLPEQQRALDALLEETAEGVIPPLPVGAHDHGRWADWSREYLGRSWFAVPFLWAESYFYRRLLEAVGYFGPGPWQGVDPFAPFKRAVHLIADNAGRELIPDLILIDHLLHTGRAGKAVLHVKPCPYYVSDATRADVLDCLHRVTQAPGRAGRIGARLSDALRGGRLGPCTATPSPARRCRTPTCRTTCGPTSPTPRSSSPRATSTTGGSWATGCGPARPPNSPRTFPVR